MDIDLDELRRVAEAAIARMAESGTYGDAETWADAADPPTVLGLIAEVKRLRARRPVVCGTCGGHGTFTVAYEDSCHSHDEPCPDCGQDNAGPGVRWEP